MCAEQVDIHDVPDFNTMYELYDPCTLMFFFRNKVPGKDPTNAETQLLWVCNAAALMCVTMSVCRRMFDSRPLRDVATSHWVAADWHIAAAGCAAMIDGWFCPAAHHD